MQPHIHQAQGVQHHLFRNQKREKTNGVGAGKGSKVRNGFWSNTNIAVFPRQSSDPARSERWAATEAHEAQAQKREKAIRLRECGSLTGCKHMSPN